MRSGFDDRASELPDGKALRVARHGSTTSSSEALLSAAASEVGVISVGVKRTATVTLTRRPPMPLLTSE